MSYRFYFYINYYKMLYICSKMFIYNVLLIIRFESEICVDVQNKMLV